jgi:hypothetical protein
MFAHLNNLERLVPVDKVSMDGMDEDTCDVDDDDDPSVPFFCFSFLAFSVLSSPEDGLSVGGDVNVVIGIVVSSSSPDASSTVEIWNFQSGKLDPLKIGRFLWSFRLITVKDKDDTSGKDWFYCLNI